MATIEELVTAVRDAQIAEQAAIDEMDARASATHEAREALARHRLAPTVPGDRIAVIAKPEAKRGLREVYLVGTSGRVSAISEIARRTEAEGE